METPLSVQIAQISGILRMKSGDDPCLNGLANQLEKLAGSPLCGGRLLDAKEMACLLGYKTERQVLDLAKEGKISYNHIGGSYRFNAQKELMETEVGCGGSNQF